MPGKGSYPTMSNLWLCVHATNYHCDFATYGSMPLCHPSPGELSDSIRCQCPAVWVSQGHGTVWNCSTVSLFHAEVPVRGCYPLSVSATSGPGRYHPWHTSSERVADVLCSCLPPSQAQTGCILVLAVKDGEASAEQEQCRAEGCQPQAACKSQEDFFHLA